MAWVNLHGKAVMAFFRLVNQTRMRFVNTLRDSLSIIRNEISKTSFANFANDITSLWMNDMCGTNFVTPFQGLELFGYATTQGVALGCLVVRFQRAGRESIVRRKNSRC